MKTSYAGFLLLTIDDVPTTIHKSALSARAMMSRMRCGFLPNQTTPGRASCPHCEHRGRSVLVFMAPT